MKARCFQRAFSWDGTIFASIRSARCNGPRRPPIADPRRCPNSTQALRRAPGAPHQGRDSSRARYYIREHRSEEHTSELQSLMRISYAVFCLKKKKKAHKDNNSIYKREHISRTQLA